MIFFSGKKSGSLLIGKFMIEKQNNEGARMEQFRKTKTEAITDADEIYYYFEMINNIAPQSILDAGMFLKRIGAISRQAMSCEIPHSVSLYGIDFFPEKKIAVYQSIYNGIATKRQFFEQEQLPWKPLFFDVAVMLETEICLKEQESQKLWSYVLQNARSIMSDIAAAKIQVERGRIKGYYPVSVGTGRYAWIPLQELGRVRE